ncbi:hypothetical protein SAMN05880582_103175 [Rhizobium sp. RU20A]|uniref:spike base protein, RCAP_Rcc01079 family n=1 Tax=Rhizobium sp. RU20A TaxID=1907412 RepID=UPI00095703B5|nr:hypothetical protein [Rhizobium sp. RU20A]SIQ73751.1 hypothetical protein SAMN05880582_103175 [Rhizobium sp. RU20A]
MPDRYASNASSLTAPASHGFAITPSDTADLPETTRAVYVGAAGTLVVRLSSGATVTFANVPAATLLPLRCERILQSGTTAGSLVGIL